MSIARNLALATALLMSSRADSAALVWPQLFGGGPCSGSLQACIDSAAAGDSIEIVSNEIINQDRYTLIDENILITRSLTLFAGPGIDAVFAAEREIRVVLGTAAVHQVTISDLNFRRGGIEVLNSAGLAGTSINLNRNRVLSSRNTFEQGCAFEVQHYGTATGPITNIGDNLVQGSADAAEVNSGICISHTAMPATATVFRNRILSGQARMLNAIGLSGEGSGTMRINANRIFGPRLANGININRFAATPMTLQITNNVIVNQDESAGRGILFTAAGTNALIANNSVGHGRYAMQLGVLASSSVQFGNNLVAFNSDFGVNFDPEPGATVTSSHNLLFANAVDDLPFSPSNLTSNPNLRNTRSMVPDSPSPVTDAGSASHVPGGVAFDVDGERRVLFGFVDIGAYELNSDLANQLTATPGNVFFNEVLIDSLPGVVLPTDRLQATAIRSNPRLPGTGRYIGVYQNPGSPSGWSVFNQNPNVNIDVGQRFSVQMPVHSKDVILQASTNADLGTNRTQIDHPALNNQPFAIAIATSYWDGFYHDVPIGLSYAANRWSVRNEDNSQMPTQRKFNIVVAPFASNNARQILLPSVGVFEYPLPHPLLDDNECAAPILGMVDDPLTSTVVFNDRPYALDYRPSQFAGAPGRWYVVSESTSAFPGNAAFNLIIDGRQAEECRAPRPDAMFRDSFE